MNPVIYAGERRRVYATVTIDSTDLFEIESASYVLFYGDTEEARGVPAIDGHTMNMLIEPQNTGDYSLCLMFRVAGELLIRSFSLTVRKNLIPEVVT